LTYSQRNSNCLICHPEFISGSYCWDAETSSA